MSNTAEDFQDTGTPSIDFLPNLDVLANRPLFRGTTEGPKFGQSLWDLSPGIETPNNYKRAVCKLDFETQPCGYREEIRRYIAARLIGPTPRTLRKRYDLPALNTIGSEFRRLRKMARWFEQRNIQGPDEVQISDIDACLASFKFDGMGQSTVAHYASLVMLLHHYGDIASLSWVSDMPWQGKVRFPNPKRNENSTKRIPEPVLDELVEWALFYVDVASADIRKAVKLLSQPEAPVRTSAAEPRTKLRNYFRRLARAKKGLPGRYGSGSTTLYSSGAKDSELEVHYNAVARAAGVPSIYAYKDLIDNQIPRLGIEYGELNVPISMHPETGLPWRPRFLKKDVRSEVKNLQSACFIICLMSGMRPEEVRKLRVGCLRSEQPIKDGPIRFKVTSKVKKGRREPEDEEWVVIPEIARAIRVAETMCDGETLFSPWKPRKFIDQQIANGESNRDINELAHVVLPCLNRINGLEKDTLEIERWMFSGSQFRRTVAFYIAHEPFGAIAGKIQYKHLSVATFEGYAGSSRSGFVQEVEAEMQLASIERFEDLYKRSKAGDWIAGPGGPRLQARIDEIREQVGDLPGNVVDRKRRRSMLRSMGKQLHLGLINDCWFDPARALCRPSDDLADRPLINGCQPANCPNSCIPQGKSERWAQVLADAKETRRQRGLSSAQIRVIDTEIDEITTALAQRTNENNSEK